MGTCPFPLNSSCFLCPRSSTTGKLALTACFPTRNSTCRALQNNVHHSFLTSNLPGLATFVARCLYVFPIFPEFSDGLTRMILSAFIPLINESSIQDISSAKSLVARLFILTINGSFAYDHVTMLKIVRAFDVKTEDLEAAMVKLTAENSVLLATATSKAYIEEYVWRIIESNDHNIAVELLQYFSIRSSEEKFLLRMIANNRLGAAKKWAYLIGPCLIRVLVREYARLNMLKIACHIINANNMREEFPEILFEYRKSVIKKFAKKSLWDFAEERTKRDPQLIEYLALLTIEMGCNEKANELCGRYSLNHLKNLIGAEPSKQTLKLGDLKMEGIIFIDKSEPLCNATSRILECEAVGVDCEWKPNHYKGAKPNKVSIFQISTDNVVFIVDLLRMCKEAPETVDNCLSAIFKSTNVLKIGYDFQCDLKQLRQSYEKFECFREHKTSLDLRNVFKETHGGLSGLSEKILGLKLDKTRRASDWEKRPLSESQLEYAALDAASLVHIFRRVGASGDEMKEDWKSKIVL